jgi:hypothetical protein
MEIMKEAKNGERKREESIYSTYSVRVHGTLQYSRGRM